MSAATIAHRIRVYGVVQGVGFRPTVSHRAAETGICGSVCNRGPYVEIFAQGEASRVAAFLDALEHRPPLRAAILKVDVQEAEIRPLAGFQIIESAKTGARFLSRRILQSVKRAKPNCSTPRTGGTSIPLSTAPAAVRG